MIQNPWNYLVRAAPDQGIACGYEVRRIRALCRDLPLGTRARPTLRAALSCHTGMATSSEADVSSADR